MRLRLLLFASVLLPFAFGQPAGTPKLGADAPAMGYKEVPEWPTQVLNAAGTPGGPWNFIQVSGVTVDAQGHILVLHRGAHPIMEFESNGKFVRSWGDGMFSEGKVGAIAPAVGVGICTSGTSISSVTRTPSSSATICGSAVSEAIAA